MNSIIKELPFIHAAQNTAEIPWENAVVWISGVAGGTRLYEWIEKEDIHHVLWINGNVSIVPDQNAPGTARFNAIVLQGATVFVGKNVTVG